MGEVAILLASVEVVFVHKAFVVWKMVKNVKMVMEICAPLENVLLII